MIPSPAINGTLSVAYVCGRCPVPVPSLNKDHSAHFTSVCFESSEEQQNMFYGVDPETLHLLIILAGHSAIKSPQTAKVLILYVFNSVRGLG